METDELPVNVTGYRLTVVEPPCPKTRDDGRGGQVVITDRNGVAQFVVSLFAKQRPVPGQRSRKGSEVRVTLETDPGEGFTEDMQVELINPRVKAYKIESEDGRTIAGISFKATGLTPVTASRPAPRPDDGK